MDAERVRELGRKAREKGRERSTSRALSSSAGSPSRLGMRPESSGARPQPPSVGSTKSVRVLPSSPLKNSLAGPSNSNMAESSSSSSSAPGLFLTPPRKRKRHREDGSEKSHGSSVVFVSSGAQPSFGQAGEAIASSSRTAPVTPQRTSGEQRDGYIKASPMTPGKKVKVEKTRLGASSSQAIVVHVSDDESEGFEIVDPEVARREIAAKASQTASLQKKRKVVKQKSPVEPLETIEEVSYVKSVVDVEKRPVSPPPPPGAKGKGRWVAMRGVSPDIEPARPRIIAVPAKAVDSTQRTAASASKSAERHRSISSDSDLPPISAMFAPSGSSQKLRDASGSQQGAANQHKTPIKTVTNVAGPSRVRDDSLLKKSPEPSTAMPTPPRSNTKPRNPSALASQSHTGSAAKKRAGTEEARIRRGTTESSALTELSPSSTPRKIRRGLHGLPLDDFVKPSRSQSGTPRKTIHIGGPNQQSPWTPSKHSQHSNASDSLTAAHAPTSPRCLGSTSKAAASPSRANPMTPVTKRLGLGTPSSSKTVVKSSEPGERQPALFSWDVEGAAESPRSKYQASPLKGKSPVRPKSPTPVDDFADFDFTEEDPVPAPAAVSSDTPAVSGSGLPLSPGDDVRDASQILAEPGHAAESSSSPVKPREGDASSPSGAAPPPAIEQILAEAAAEQERAQRVVERIKKELADQEKEEAAARAAARAAALADESEEEEEEDFTVAIKLMTRKPKPTGIGIGRDALRDRSASVMTTRSGSTPLSAGLGAPRARASSARDPTFDRLLHGIKRDMDQRVNMADLEEAQAFLEREIADQRGLTETGYPTPAPTTDSSTRTEKAEATDSGGFGGWKGFWAEVDGEDADVKPGPAGSADLDSLSLTSCLLYLDSYGAAPADLSIVMSHVRRQQMSSADFDVAQATDVVVSAAHSCMMRPDATPRDVASAVELLMRLSIDPVTTGPTQILCQRYIAAGLGMLDNEQMVELIVSQTKWAAPFAQEVCIAIAKAAGRATQPARVFGRWSAVAALDPAFVDEMRKSGSTALGPSPDSLKALLVDTLILAFDSDLDEQAEVDKREKEQGIEDDQPHRLSASVPNFELFSFAFNDVEEILRRVVPPGAASEADARAQARRAWLNEMIEVLSTDVRDRIPYDITFTEAPSQLLAIVSRLIDRLHFQGPVLIAAMMREERGDTGQTAPAGPKGAQGKLGFAKIIKAGKK